jgi:hypothetical protein
MVWDLRALQNRSLFRFYEEVNEMPGNECTPEEVMFLEAVKEFEEAADAAENISWGDLAFDVIKAWGGAALAAITLSPTGPGAVIGGGAVGIFSFWHDVYEDIQENPAAEAAFKKVEEAFKDVQECREEHKKDGEDPFGEPPIPSPLLDPHRPFPVIPYEDPDPGSETSDDDILIYDDEKCFDEDLESGIIICDEDDVDDDR